MRISDWSSDVCSSDLIADRYLDRTQLAQRKPTEHVIQTIRKQNCDHVALGDAMRGQAMCQTIHPDVDRGKAQRLAVILPRPERRSEEHTSELQSLMRNSYAVFCLKKKKNKRTHENNTAAKSKKNQ